MAFQPSAPPLGSAYSPLACEDEADKTEKRSSLPPQKSRSEVPQQRRFSVDLHHQSFASDCQQHHELGYVTDAVFQHHMQFPPPAVPQSDGSVVFGFPVAPDSANPRWRTGLCQCCSDPTTCLIGWCCPCVLFGKIAEDLDNGATSCAAAAAAWYLLHQFTSFGWIYSHGYRSKLRSRYGFRRRPCCDCMVHCCCWPCAFCQEYREIHIRRLESEAVWERYAALAPPPQQIMRH